MFKFSEQNLLNSLNKLMKLNVNELEIMSKNALDIIKNNYDKNIIFKEYTNFYKNFLKMKVLSVLNSLDLRWRTTRSTKKSIIN